MPRRDSSRRLFGCDRNSQASVETSLDAARTSARATCGDRYDIVFAKHMSKSHRTQVAIIGAGPAGLVLAQLLHLAGVECIVLETQTRKHVENRVRAGVLEQASVDLLNEAGVGERMRREGLVHRGIELRFAGAGHRIDFPELTGGRSITVYGQQEVVKDLIAARLTAGGQLRFGASDLAVHGTAIVSP